MIEAISQFSTFQIVILCISALMIGINKTALPGIGILPVVLLANSFDARLSTGMQLLMLAWADIMAVIYFRRSADWKLILRLLPWSLSGLAIGIALAVLCNNHVLIVGSLLQFLMNIRCTCSLCNLLIRSSAFRTVNHILGCTGMFLPYNLVGFLCALRYSCTKFTKCRICQIFIILKIQNSLT